MPWGPTGGASAAEGWARRLREQDPTFTALFILKFRQFDNKVRGLPRSAPTVLEMPRVQAGLISRRCVALPRLRGSSRQRCANAFLFTNFLLVNELCFKRQGAAAETGRSIGLTR